MEGIQIFEQKVGYNGDIVYLKVNGYIDTSTSFEMVNKLKSLIDQGFVQFTIDLSSVNYVSSAGWGVFVGEIKSVREKGGDIKLVHLTPDVYDVFEMLEFNKILRSYDSVEETINEYDIMRGYDITKTPIKEWHGEDKKMMDSTPDIQISRITAEKIDSQDFTKRAKIRKTKDPSMLPLSEKIKNLITEKPLLSLWGIKMELTSPMYGRTKINIVKLYALLKELNLETKDKRHRYYRSR